jgi:hypothetical protein
VLKTAPDQAVLFYICAGCLAVSAGLWCLVRDGKVVGAAKSTAVAAH